MGSHQEKFTLVTGGANTPSNNTMIQNTKVHKAFLGVGIIFVIGAIIAICTHNAGAPHIIVSKVCATIGAPLMLIGIIGLISHYAIHGCKTRQSSAHPTVPSEADRGRIARERLERFRDAP